MCLLTLFPPVASRALAVRAVVSAGPGSEVEVKTSYKPSQETDAKVKPSQGQRQELGPVPKPSHAMGTKIKSGQGKRQNQDRAKDNASSKPQSALLFRQLAQLPDLNS